MAATTAVLYPVNISLEGQRALVVGAGRIAARKIEGLAEAGARITVVAPAAVTDIASNPRIRWHERTYRRGEVASYRIAIAATGDPEVDGQVFTDADAAGVLVNSADDPAHCSFTLPAILRRGPLQVTVSTRGSSPAAASWIRDQLAGYITSDHERLLELLSRTREELRSEGRSTEHAGWRSALADGLFDLLVAGEDDAAGALLRERLGLDSAEG